MMISMKKRIEVHKRYDKLPVVLIFMLPALVFLIIFIAYPAIISAYYSFCEIKEFVEFVGTKNWIRLFNDPVIKTCIVNNFILVIIAVVIQVPGAFIVAFLLLKAKVICKGIYRVTYFMPVILTVSVVGVLWTWIYNPQIGFLNYGLKAIGFAQLASSWLGNSKTALPAVIVATIWRFTGFYIVLFMAAVARIPDDIYDAATVDGANNFRLAINIVAPMLSDVFVVAMTIAVVSSIQRFDLIYIMTAGGPIHSTELLATYLFKIGILSANLGYGSAIATLLFLLTLGLVIIQMLSMKRSKSLEF